MSDLEMILNPDLWPVWPYLPMKRSGELGFFSNYNIYKNDVQFYIGNLYDIKNATLQDLTPEQAIEAGWRVD